MKRARNIWRTGWRVAVCLLLLFWIFHAIFVGEGRRAWEAKGNDWSALDRGEQWRLAWTEGPAELWRTLRLVKLAAFAVSVAFMGTTILLGMLRWRQVLGVHGLNLSLGRTAEISLVAHFFNSFLLGSTGGDLLKAYYAARETHHKKTEAVITVAVDRLIGLLTMLLFACLMMLPNLGLLAAHRRLGALAWIIVLMSAGCATLLLVSFWGGVSRTLPNARSWLRRMPQGEMLERALEACRVFGKERGFFLRVGTISLALNIFCVMQILVLAHGLGLTVSPRALFVIVPMVVCLSALPITPSGLGVRENLYVLMLAVPEINVDATHALSLSLLAYAGSLLWSIVGGLVYVLRRERDQLDRVGETEVLTKDTA